MLPRSPGQLKAQLRAEELGRITELLARFSRSDSGVLVLGPGGIGKTTLLDCLETNWDNSARARVDFASSQNRSALGVASSLLSRFDSQQTGTFYSVAAKARTKGSERVLRDALNLCAALAPSLIGSQSVVLLDNIDRSSRSVRTWLLRQVLGESGTAILATAKLVPPDLKGFHATELPVFHETQLASLARFWAQSVPNIPEQFLVNAICAYSDGHPVKAELVAWAASLLEQDVFASCSNLSQLVKVAVSTLSMPARSSLQVAVIAHQRLNLPIMSRLAKDARIETIQELPFASAIHDRVGGVVVHPVALEAIAAGLGMKLSAREEGTRQLAMSIYPRMLTEGHGEEATATLELEQLRYIANLSGNNEFATIEDSFRTRLLRGELWRADEIAQLAQETALTGPEALRESASLIVAENLIARHDIADAIRSLDGFANSRLAASPAPLRLRVQYLRCKCVTSPAATSGKEIFTVTGTLESLLYEAIGSDLMEFAEDIRFELAMAYRFVARYEQALNQFIAVESNTRDAAARVRAIEEQAHMHRFMADLQSAEQAHNRAALLRLEVGIPTSGHGLYSLATLRRDQNDFETAERLYEKAAVEASEEGDDYLACTIRGDWAWMHFLAGQVAQSETELAEYQRLAELYSFSRELSEAWHMRYHLAAEKKNWRDAHFYLNRALVLAQEFGNVIMQLDCMMHGVQRCVREKRVMDATVIIEGMEKIEAEGCGVRVFRGRALVYQGDGLIEAGRERDAILAWQQGFDLVANFGHSRSNVELLDEMLASRKPLFLSLLDKYSNSIAWIESLSPIAASRVRAALGG